MSSEAFARPERNFYPPSGVRRGGALLEAQSNLTLLAERAQRFGDPRELARLARSLEPAVRRTCTGVFGRAHEELEDALQECLLEIVRALPNYRSQGDFLHYANKISLRVALSLRRRDSERKRRFDSLEACPTEPAVPDRELNRARQLRRVLRLLPEAQAEALSLHFMLGFSVDEAAALTRVSPNTVKTRIRLGKRRLRKRLRALPD